MQPNIISDVMDQSTAAPGADVVSEQEHREIEQFQHLEARLADESRYADWEGLLSDDMVYWIPVGSGDYDPQHKVSITYDNRRRLKNRIKQLMTGERYAQVPASPMRRLLSNIEVHANADGTRRVYCNFVLHEYRLQSTNQICTWAGQMQYTLRRVAGELKISYKKVTLINSTGPVPSLAFIL